MSNKVAESQCSNEISTTPRRLRSGTHYGDHHVQAQLTAKKENKKIVKEPNQNCDSDNPFKADKDKASKHYPITIDDRQMKRQKAHMSTPSIIPSPDQNEKNHTLKAILESIEPNLCIKVKNKSSKRKSLRDILDQKFPAEKAYSKENYTDKDQKRKTENRPVVKNGESHHHSNHFSKETVDKNSYCAPKTNPEVTEKQTTMHTHSTVHSNSVAKEQPDDYWPLTRKYLEKNSAKTLSSVELRIKAGHSRDADDCSQTFRISCSRPDASASSPTAPPRTMKPDIVLKVRPRSSSLSALHTAPHGGSHGRREGSSRLYSAITSLSLKNSSSSSSSSSVKSNHDLEPLSAHLKPPGESPSFGPNSHGIVLQGNGSEPKPAGQFSSTKSFTLNHEDVLEESKLPPVARTVELLSEPHDDHLNHSDASERFSGHRPTSCNHYDSRYVSLVHSGFDSRATAPTTFRTPCEEEDSDGREAEGEKVRSAEGQSRKPNSHHSKTFKTAMFLGRDSASTCLSLRGRKEEGEEEEERWTEDCDRYLTVKPPLDKTADVKELSAKLSDAAEEPASSRRRRKGRPSRRCSAERPWHTSPLCFSPQEGEEDGEEEEEEWGRERERRQGRTEKYGGGGGGGGERTAAPGVTGKSGSKCRSATASEPEPDVSATLTCTATRKGMLKKQGEGNSGGRKSRKGLDQETLWANPELDSHGFLLWASENRSELEKRIPDASGVEVEAQLAAQWRQLPFSGKLHFLCRARDASSDHSKHTVRKKKAAQVERKETAASDGRSVYEEFLRLPQERQKDLLRKWLRFFQKMLPRLEYQDFIGDFKKACKSLSLRPMPARRKNARLRNLDPSHYQMLFERIRETRPRVISVYNKRKAREEQLLSQSFCAMVRRLIVGQPWPFVRGCRSKALGELLKDIQQLEVEEVLAQIDLPLTLTSADLADPFLDGKDLQDSLGALCPVDVLDSTSPESISCQTGTTFTFNTTKDAGPLRKGPNGTSAIPVMTGTSVTSHGDSSGELPDSPVVLKVLDSLRHVVDLPVLDQRSLDSIFLAPPSRGSRSQTCRDTQFQNSATYRRTLLYKHIQPLLDARGMPLPSSALYHTHSAQYFYSDDR